MEWAIKTVGRQQTTAGLTGNRADTGETRAVVRGRDAMNGRQHTRTESLNRVRLNTSCRTEAQKDKGMWKGEICTDGWELK